jgi:hypothetical protein
MDLPEYQGWFGNKKFCFEANYPGRFFAHYTYLLRLSKLKHRSAKIFPALQGGKEDLINIDFLFGG